MAAIRCAFRVSTTKGFRNGTAIRERTLEQPAPDNSRQQQKQYEEGFSACLLVMDDNHYLIEWLVYHYQSLPLKRLIVGVDLRSQTSPTMVLDRYRQRG
jgi:hypothetical protein